MSSPQMMTMLGFGCADADPIPRASAATEASNRPPTFMMCCTVYLLLGYVRRFGRFFLPIGAARQAHEGPLFAPRFCSLDAPLIVFRGMVAVGGRTIHETKVQYGGGQPVPTV